MKITRIKPPKFRVGRYVLNEYEARQLTLEVALGIREPGIIIKDEEGNEAAIQRDGSTDRHIANWDIGSKISVERFRHVSKMRKAQKHWEMLGDIPVNEDGEIEEPFLRFPAGTDREVIWDWFEEEYNLSVAKDLMFEDFKW